MLKNMTKHNAAKYTEIWKVYSMTSTKAKLAKDNRYQVFMPEFLGVYYGSIKKQMARDTGRSQYLWHRSRTTLRESCVSSFVQVMASHFFGSEPLTEPVLIYC